MGTRGTWLDLCNVIAKWMNSRKALNVTGHDVFHYSPTGELYMLYEWRQMVMEDSEFIATLTDQEQTFLGIDENSSADNSPSQE
jgi:hypothetical protein